MGYVLWKIAVLLGVWVTGARAFSCYWVCGWQERGLSVVTGCVGDRSEAFQLLLGVWVTGARAFSCYWVRGWQERGISVVTGCVGDRSEAFQLLLGVWVTWARHFSCYWVCGWQERGISVVTGCVGDRSEAFQLLVHGLEFWVLKRTSKSCCFVRPYNLEYFMCNKSRFSIRNNPLTFLWAPPFWPTTFFKPLPPSPTQRHKIVAILSSYTSSAILIA